MRIGIFGGTFDPIHLGHLNAIAYSFDQAHLDQVLVFVAGDPYQKEEPEVPVEMRLSWVRESCEDYFPGRDDIIVDDREITREGPTYTIDTIHELVSEYPGDELVLIVGEDIPPTMSSWKDAEEIAELTELFVVPRSIIPVSSTHIRNCFAEKIPVTGLLPDKIERQIREYALYNKDTRSKE